MHFLQNQTLSKLPINEFKRSILYNEMGFGHNVKKEKEKLGTLMGFNQEACEIFGKHTMINPISVFLIHSQI